MTWLVPLPVIASLLGAALSLAVASSRRAQYVIGLVTLCVSLAAGVAALVEADSSGTLVAQAGGWPAPYGITLLVDRLAGVMLVVSFLVLLAVYIYANSADQVARREPGFHPAYLVLAAGVGLCFVTGDLFNLFVAFELMLSASYVLITMGGRPDQVRAGMTYVVISLIASTFFLAAIAFIYAATGTVNMAQLSERMGDLPDSVQTAFALMLLVVFGVKAAVFPLFSWLPDSYPTAPGPITAVFAGLLTKVGVYAIIRTQITLFDDAARPATFMVILAGLTMVIGVFGAIAQDDIKRILSFHIVSQIGYMIMGLAFFTVAGVAGAIFFLVNNIVLKTALLLVAGLVERTGGSARLSAIGGLVRTTPVLAVMFALPALSLAGLPPWGGFVAKLGLARAGVLDGQHAIVAVSLAVSLLTLYSMSKIWMGAFWGEPDERPDADPIDDGVDGGTFGMVGPTVVIVLAGVAMAVWAGPLWELAERAAVELLDKAAVEQVSGAGS